MGALGARRAAGKGFRDCAQGDRRRCSRSWGPLDRRVPHGRARWTCLTLERLAEDGLARHFEGSKSTRYNR